MDVQLVMSVLNDALAKYPHPEIFNTDQGSQYTSEVHTQRLKNLGITISMDGRGVVSVISKWKKRKWVTTIQKNLFMNINNRNS